MIGKVLRLVGRVLSGAWRELGDAVEWRSHGSQYRPPFAEGTYIEDPKDGWGLPNEGADEKAAEEHRTLPD